LCTPFLGFLFGNNKQKKVGDMNEKEYREGKKEKKKENRIRKETMLTLH